MSSVTSTIPPDSNYYQSNGTSLRSSSSTDDINESTQQAPSRVEMEDRSVRLDDCISQAVAPLVISINVNARPQRAVQMYEGDHDIFDLSTVDDVSDREHTTGFVLPESDNEDTAYATSDASSTVCDGDRSFHSSPAESLPLTYAGMHFQTFQEQEQENTMRNGFVDFSLNSIVENRRDYFVISFSILSKESRSLLQDCLGHSHYFDATHIARVVQTTSNQPFDLGSWPRTLQIEEVFDANEIDGSWMVALRQVRIHVNIFAVSRLHLTFCSARHGGCLRILFDVLTEQRMFAKCTPSLDFVGQATPEIFIVPVGPNTYMPRFIRYNNPKFQPESDMLLVLMVLSDDGSSLRSPSAVYRRPRDTAWV